MGLVEDYRLDVGTSSTLAGMISKYVGIYSFKNLLIYF